MAVVSFHYADVSSIPVKAKRPLQSFIGDLFKREGKHLEQLSYVFCRDPFILELNRSHLQHDYFTDIITFDLSSGDAIIGEIYISVDTVYSNATDHSVTKQQELLRVIFHGALHLCGYKDKKKSEIALMRQKEEEYLLLWDKSL